MPSACGRRRGSSASPPTLIVVELRGARPPDADERRGVTDRVDAGGRARDARSRSRTSPSMARPGRRRCASRGARTRPASCRARASARTIALPRYPVPPVTRTRMSCASRIAVRDVICCSRMFKRQTNRLRGLRLVRVAGRRQRRQVLHAAAAAIPGCGASARAAALRQRSRVRRARHLRLHRPVHRWRCCSPCDRRRHHGARRLVLDAVARQPSRRCVLGASGADPGVRLRHVVDACSARAGCTAARCTSCST